MTNAAIASGQSYACDKKHLVHFLVPYEKKLIGFLLPRVPAQVSTVHLTMMTLVWSGAIVLSGYLSSTQSTQWLWLFSACIFLQYVTDMLDGAVGRERNTGLIKWGFYMDHFLDYLFLSAVVIGYSFLLPSSHHFLVLLCLTFSAGFMVHVFMDFTITNNFKISCNQFGVSEMRMSLILFNIALVIFGPQLLVQVFPFFVVAAGMALLLVVFSAQKVYRHLDVWRQASQSTST